MLLEHALCEILLLLTYPENAKPLSDNEGPVCSPTSRPEDGPGATGEATRLPLLSGGVCHESQSWTDVAGNQKINK